MEIGEIHMAGAAKKIASTDVDVIGTGFSTEELASIDSFEAALALVTEKIGEENVVRADAEIGDGFKLLENKDSLIGTPMILVSWDFHMGDHGEFVAAKVVTKDGRKFIVNDGSSGLRDQLMGFTAKKNQRGGLLCAKGLRRSDYKYTDEDGKEKPATTYYLDTSA